MRVSNDLLIFHNISASQPDPIAPARHQNTISTLIMNQLQWKSKQRTALLAIACCSAAVLCLQGLLSAPITSAWDAGDIDYESHMHRHLLATLDESHLMENEQLRTIDPQENEDGASQLSPIGTRPLSPFLSSLASYTLEDAISEANPFEYTFAVMVYDPSDDQFYGYFSKHHQMRESYKKLFVAMKFLSFMLRKVFPGRFTSSSEEFVLAISAGDYPHVSLSELPHVGGVAPVLAFGSVFRNEKLYPNLVAMPMTALHLACFASWSDSGQVCKGLSAMPDGDLAFGKELGLEWEDLKRQVVWRGNDYIYLDTLMQPQLRSPASIGILQRKIEQIGQKLRDEDKGRAAVDFLRFNYNELLPRWKGVVLTAEAELAAREGELPWANIKFTGDNRSDKHQMFEEVGVSVTGDYIRIEDQAHFKYLIDIGGGGGTTWTGTTSKLAMPGLLFHHITPTKDYFHDRIKPYVHYVPISPDLSDLKEKFDWAESHPNDAKQISDQATEFMRYLGTPEGFGQLFQEDFVEPLRRIIEAYQPVSVTHPGKSWRDVLESPAWGSSMVRVLECKGLNHQWYESCTEVGGERIKKWHETRTYPADTEGNRKTRENKRTKMLERMERLRFSRTSMLKKMKGRARM